MRLGLFERPSCNTLTNIVSKVVNWAIECAMWPRQVAVWGTRYVYASSAGGSFYTLWARHAGSSHATAQAAACFPSAAPCSAPPASSSAAARALNCCLMPRTKAAKPNLPAANCCSSTPRFGSCGSHRVTAVCGHTEGTESDRMMMVSVASSWRHDSSRHSHSNALPAQPPARAVAPS